VMHSRRERFVPHASGTVGASWVCCAEPCLPAAVCVVAATEVSRLGVKSVYTPRGMTSAVWQQGLQMCAEAAGGSGGGKKQKASAKGGSRAY
jgi:hypothetical protein